MQLPRNYPPQVVVWYTVGMFMASKVASKTSTLSTITGAPPSSSTPPAQPTPPDPSTSTPTKPPLDVPMPADDGGPPRFFSPFSPQQRTVHEDVAKLPLMLYLPGIDGTGLAAASQVCVYLGGGGGLGWLGVHAEIWRGYACMFIPTSTHTLHTHTHHIHTHTVSTVTAAL